MELKFSRESRRRPFKALTHTGCAKGLNRSGSAVENEKAPEPMEQLMNTWIEMSQISHKGT